MNIDEMQAGPELDALIAEKVMGWTSHTEQILDGCLVKFWNDERGSVVACQENWGAASDITNTQWSPSTDIAAAWQVVEKLDLLQEKILTKHEDGLYVVCDLADIGIWPEYYKGANASVPLAICRAALKAVME